MNQVQHQSSLSRKAIASAIALWLGGAGVHAAGVGAITQGSGSMTTQGAVTTVNQTSQGLKIDWSRFNVGVGETLAFVQPNARAVAVNLVTSSMPAELMGQLTATGSVFILSPNGLLIGAGASVTTGAHFVGSTSELTSLDERTGAVRTRGILGNKAQVLNAGLITTGAGGVVALIGTSVVNTGTILAPQGQVLMLAGDRVVFKSSESSTINYVVDPASVASSVSNTGNIVAHGGRIELDARSLVSSVVNTSGVIEAGGVDGSRGVIRLTALGEAGRVVATGVVDAGVGGTVTAHLGSKGQLSYSASTAQPSEPQPSLQRVEAQALSIVANDKTYDGTRAATVDIRVSDLPPGEALDLTIDQAAFTNQNAGSGRTVALSFSSVSAASGALYKLPQTLSATILKKEIGVTVDTKVYDGTNTAVVHVNEGDIVASDQGKVRVTLGSAQFSDQNAGTDKSVGYASTLSGAGVTPRNYFVSTTATGTITPKKIGVTAADKVYDGTTDVEVSVNQSDIIAADQGKVRVTLSNESFDNRNVGSGKTVTYESALTGAGMLAKNYEVAVSTTAAVTPKELTLTASADSKVYDGTTSSVGAVSVTGLVGGDILAPGTLTQSFDSRNAGSRTLAVNNSYTVNDGNGGNNYTVTTVSAEGTINRAPLTITANNANKVQDGVPYSGGNGVTAAGLVAGESLANLQGSVAYGGSSQGAQAVGSYVISANGLSSDNYQISYQNGALAINARGLNGVDDTVGNANNGGTQTTPINVDLAGLGDLLSGLPATAAGEEEDDEKVKTRRRSDRSPVRVMDGGVRAPATLR